MTSAGEIRENMNQIEFGDEYFSVLFVIFRSMGAGLLHKNMSGLVISVRVHKHENSVDPENVTFGIGS